MFIVLSGLDGSGKTTQASLVAEHLRDQGHRVTLTREPGGTPLGAKIRSLIFDPEPRNGAEVDLLLFLADRTEHIAKVIRPALNRGDIVICDRYVESTFAYQADQIGENAIQRILELHTLLKHPWPNLTLYLDLSVEDAIARLHARQQDNASTTYETTERARIESLYRRYSEMREHMSCVPTIYGKYCAVNANQSIDAVTEALVAKIQHEIIMRAAP